MKRRLLAYICILILPLLLLSCGSGATFAAGAPMSADMLLELREALSLKEESGTVDDSKQDGGTSDDNNDQTDNNDPNDQNDNNQNDNHGTGDNVTGDTSQGGDSEEPTTVFWLASGQVYHLSEDCHYIKGKPNVSTGTVEAATTAGKTKLCSHCGK